jgi:FkbM family methyltransferase
MLSDSAARVAGAMRKRLRGMLPDADRRAGQVVKAARDAEGAASRAASAETIFAASAGQFTPYVAVERDGALFFVSTESTYGRRLFANRQWADDRQLDRTLRALSLADLKLGGTTFVDIGAHIGTTTIQALKRYGFTSALAFEPDPENFRILRANLAANGLDGLVRAFNVAISNRVGTGQLQVSSRGAATHKLLSDGDLAPQALPVPVTTFDRLAAEGSVDLDDVGLLWIDVEGSEIKVLKGARTLLDRSVPIVIEFSPRRFRVAGQLESLVDILSPSYTHFLDLKQSSSSTLGFEPLCATEELLSRHRKKTDLLVVRLPE